MMPSGPPLFSYFHLMQGLQSEGGNQNQDWSHILAWLDFALEHSIDTGLSLENDVDVAIGLTPESMKRLSLPVDCAAEHAIASALDTVHLVLTSVWKCLLVIPRVLCRRPLISTGLLLIIWLVLGRIYNEMKWRPLLAEIRRVEALAHRMLMNGSRQWHKALVLRDGIMYEAYAPDYASQDRFRRVIWPRVSHRIGRDERVLKRDWNDGGTICEIWRWQGLL
jgi:hypothetical protein